MGWIVPWSGGKDSTATIITMLDDGVPIDKIFHVRMMATETLPATHEVMTNFVDECVERFKRQGLNVEIVKSRPFDSIASAIHKRSKYPEAVGKPYGFRTCQRGYCSFQLEKPRLCNNTDNVMLGICADEPKRMTEGRHSILFDKGITQRMAYELCKERGLLSPLYALGVKRDGCFFCPNAGKAEVALLTDEQKALIRKWMSMTLPIFVRTKDWRKDLCDK